MARRAAILLLVLVLAPLSCAREGGELHAGRGVVKDVSADEGQVLVQHEDIEGLMPAMTMSFDVPDEDVLAKLAPGQAIDFALRVRGERYEIIGVSVLEDGDAEGDGAFEALNEVKERAFAFDLVDQDGEPLSLGDLAGRAVLLDFVFTTCPGPCPILTGIHVSVQNRLPDALREHVHFVSVSLDPENDTPEALRAYAEARGADLTGWSFLTGDPWQVDAVLTAYGVGRVAVAGEEIQHTLVTYLIDPEGFIAERYLGLSHEPEAVVADLQALVPEGLP